MSYKISVILSSIFIIIAFLLATDITTLQFIQSDLDAKSVNISYLISKNSLFDDSFTTSIEEHFKVDFICQKRGAPAFGEEINYQISTTFKPLIMSSESMTVSISRFAIVGYYG